MFEKYFFVVNILKGVIYVYLRLFFLLSSESEVILSCKLNVELYVFNDLLN